MLTTDPLTGQARIVSPGRAKRLGPRPAGCPFCLGNEETTPPEVDRYADGDSWRARVVPNLFPLTDRHEVIILTSRHVTTTRDLTVDEWQVALEMWRRRIDHHVESAGDEGSYAHLFVNDGKGAGASLEHTHAQLVVVPAMRATDELTARVSDAGSCAACELATMADDHPLVVYRGGGYTLCAARAPRTNEGLVLVPHGHETSFAPGADTGLAEAMHAAVHALPEADFNCWLVQSPRRDAHWYVEFAPRTSTPAGVELALGLGVSIVSPEDAAERSRQRLAGVTAAR